MAKRIRLAGAALLGGPALLLSAASCVSFVTKGPPAVTPDLAVYRDSRASTGPRPLKVMTLNLAHGRADGRNQLLLRKRTIESNLKGVAALMRREAPDLVALQEADGPSAWSGRFSHVDTLGADAGMSHGVRAENVRGLGLSYGTALLGGVPFEDPLAVTFRPTWPTFSKGFVVAAVKWPGRPDLVVDVVSVHLDFASRFRRRKQLRHLSEVLARRGRPVVVMGDLNCGWSGREASVREFANGLGLKAYRPEERIATFPTTGGRIDWILLSEELEFRYHEVLPATVSDHLPVAAIIDYAG